MTNYLQTEFDFDSEELIELIDELPFWSAPFGIRLLEKVRLRKNINALDIGFGAGFPLTELAMRLGETSKVYGVDPWEAAVKRAEKKLNYYGITNVELIKGVAEGLPFKDASIDLITSNNGINNVADLNLTLNECSRVLKQGGQFVQTINLDTTMIEFYDVLKSVLESMNLETEAKAIHDHIYEKRKPLPEFLDLLRSNGFNLVDVAEDRFEYNYIDGTAMLNHYFIRLAFLPSWKLLVPQLKQSEVFDLVEQRMNKIAQVQNGFRLRIPFVVIDCEKK